jgi:Undecaprenyl-phosphate galactose phosphotransferase WbaP
VEELRRLTTATSAVLLALAAFTFWVRTAEYYSRLIFAFAWILALFLVPLGRWLARLVAGQLNAWGEPVAVIGAGPQGEQITRFLQKRLRFGLKPVKLIDPVEPGELEKDTGLETAILVSAECPQPILRQLANHQVGGFKRLILISDLSWLGSLGVAPYDLEGLLGLEVRSNLLSPWLQMAKRLFDVVLACMTGLILMPLMGLIALAIRLDSPGGALYAHNRRGHGGRRIRVWKFRSMVDQADTVLANFLDSDAQAAQEWQEQHKLKHDPRITRVGRCLRRTSLDELPQLWNILKGEMSWVGPRPIVDEEIQHYQEGYQLYCQVHPGLTGFWQVSGRGEASYPERVRFDEYYVRNWSLWLDLYILLRTVLVVLRGEGAY